MTPAAVAAALALTVLLLLAAPAGAALARDDRSILLEWRASSPR
jgi:hypothetical protein